MGKIRVKVLGDEELEQQQVDATKARKALRQAQDKTEKQAEVSVDETAKAAETAPVEETKPEKKPRLDEANKAKREKKEKFIKANKKIRSKSYMAKVDLVDKNKNYSLSEAITLLPQLKRAKFDETVELHVTTTETGVSGSVSLPHGTGKQMRIAIADGADQKALDALIAKIDAGTIDFDILIATPESMPKLAKAARVLGPRGLMPNPKNGTVTPKPEEVAKKYEGGQINFKTESKFPLLHVAVGKVSFGEDKIKDNVKTVLRAIDSKKIKNVTLKSTMSPAIHLDLASL